MKTERRHELKENDLIVMLDSAREYLAGHGARVGAAVVAAIVVIAVVSIAVRSRAAALEDAWQRKTSLVFDNLEDGRQSLETLRELCAESADPSFVLTALIDQGRHALRFAQQVQVPPDPELNEQARAAFEELLLRFGDNPLAFGAAHCGLATVEENAFVLDGDASRRLRAQEHLEAVITNPAVSRLPFYGIAAARNNNLDNVFTVARFAPAAIEEEVAALPTRPGLNLPGGLTATPVAVEEVPKRILQKVQMGEDGKLKVIETIEE